MIVRKKTRPPMPWKPLLAKICCTGILCLAAWFVFLQSWAMVFPFLLNYYEVETGTLQRQLDVDRALVIRDETVVFASRAGTLNPVAQEGQRVAEREPVAVIRTSGGASQVMEAPGAGVVCYHTDGWEKVLTPQNVLALELVNLDKSPPALQESASGVFVEAGQPLFKIVNNLQPTLIWFHFDSQYLDLFPAVGKKLTFSLDDKICQGTLKNLTSHGVTGQGVLELDRKELLHERQVQLSIILAKAEGPVIPNRALVLKDNEQGVYKKTLQGYQWIPVQVVLQGEDYSVVDGLLRGDRVITNPYLIDGVASLPAN